MYNKKDPALGENQRPVNVLSTVSKISTGIKQKQLTTHFNDFYHVIYENTEKGFSIQFTLLPLIGERKRSLLKLFQFTCTKDLIPYTMNLSL